MGVYQVGSARPQLYAVVADKRRGRLDKAHVPRQAAVVPPVRVDGRHRVGVPSVVDADHERVARRLDQTRDLELKRRAPADVLSELLAVQVDLSLVIRGSEIDEEP